MSRNNVNMKDKICIITGANSGIGKATALGLAKMNATVVMLCRNKEAGKLPKKKLSMNPGIQM